MIPNCPGCEEEFDQIAEYEEMGLHFATTRERTGIGERKHIFIIMVNDLGEIEVGK